jgi:hypothetical protein
MDEDALVFFHVAQFVSLDFVLFLVVVIARYVDEIICDVFGQCVSGSANFISMIDLGQRGFAVFAWNRDNFDSWWNDERPRLR